MEAGARDQNSLSVGITGLVLPDRGSNDIPNRSPPLGLQAQPPHGLAGEGLRHGVGVGRQRVWDEGRFRAEIERDIDVHSESFRVLSRHILENNCVITDQAAWSAYIDVGARLFEEMGPHGSRSFLSVVKAIEGGARMSRLRGTLGELSEFLDDPTMWKNISFLGEPLEVRFLALVSLCRRGTGVGFGLQRNPSPRSNKQTELMRSVESGAHSSSAISAFPVCQFTSRTLPDLPTLSIFHHDDATRHTSSSSSAAATVPLPSTSTSTSSTEHTPDDIVVEVRVDAVEVALDPEETNVWQNKPTATIWWKTQRLHDWADNVLHTTQGKWISYGDEQYCHYNVLGLVEVLGSAGKVSLVHLLFSDVCQHQGTAAELLSIIAEKNPTWSQATIPVLYVSGMQVAQLSPYASAAFTKLHDISSKVKIITSSTKPIDTTSFALESNVLEFNNIVNPLVIPPVAETLLQVIFRLGLFEEADPELWKELSCFFFGPASMIQEYIEMVKRKQQKVFGAIKMAARQLQESIFSRYVRGSGSSRSLEGLQGIFQPGQIKSETAYCMRYKADAQEQAQRFFALSKGLNANYLSVVVPVAPLEFCFIPPFPFGSLQIAEDSADTVHGMSSFPWLHLVTRYLNSSFKTFCLQELITPGSKLRKVCHSSAGAHSSMLFTDTPNFRIGFVLNIPVERACALGTSLLLLSEQYPLTFVTPVRSYHLENGNLEYVDGYYFIQITDSKNGPDLQGEAYDFVHNMNEIKAKSDFCLFLSAEDIHIQNEKYVSISGSQIPGFTYAPAPLPSRTQQKEEAQTARAAKQGKRALEPTPNPTAHKD
ncbi:hypothetical protein Pelo_17839 [Pelomyxa schiedti]|nr:hypothetical protein Pelo_17839 [Pelomyxa schiedti]